jgi:protein arginine N-methyltransferase 7
MRVIPVLRSALQAGVLAPGARIVPRAAQLHAMLIELRLDTVRGFDLTAMNAYRWHPTAEAVQLGREPHRKMSAPFRMCDVDLYQAVHADRDTGTATDDVAQLAVTITADGVFNAVAVWYTLDLLEADSDKDAPVAELHASETCAVYYLDERTVSIGMVIQLGVQRDDTQLVFCTTPPQWRPRHAAIPSWHYDMLNDDARNAAYERAISRAVANRKRTHGEVRVRILHPCPIRPCRSCHADARAAHAGAGAGYRRRLRAAVNDGGARRRGQRGGG